MTKYGTGKGRWRQLGIASTIRHNRAKGTHSIDMMVDVVRQLTEAGSSNEWIKNHLGMDDDELLRLKQISGLAALFTARDFSPSWEIEGKETDVENEEFEDCEKVDLQQNSGNLDEKRLDI